MMRAHLLQPWFFLPAALLFMTFAERARAADPTETVKKEDTPCEKQYPWCGAKDAPPPKVTKPARGAWSPDAPPMPDLRLPSLEFSLGPTLVGQGAGALLGGQMALRALWRVSGRHQVGLMLEGSVAIGSESGSHSSLGLVGYRYAPSDGRHFDLLPVYTRARVADGLHEEGYQQGETRYVERTWIAPKLRAGFGGSVDGVRIGIAFELVIDVSSFLFGVSLYLGGLP